MAQLNFDSSQVAPAVAPEAIPSAWYKAYMSNSEMKPTSKGDGSFLNVEYTIMEGQYAGTKQFDRMNLVNPNPAAVEIGYKQLSAVCHAVGVIQVADSSQLHNRPLMIKVSLRPAGLGADGKYYDATNEIKGVKAFDPNAVVNSAPVAAPMAPSIPTAPAAPWTPPAAPVAPAAPVTQPVAQPAQWAPPAAPVTPAAPVESAAPAGMPPWAAAPAAPAAPVAPVAPATPAVVPGTPPWATPPAA